MVVLNGRTDVRFVRHLVRNKDTDSLKSIRMGKDIVYVFY